MIIKITAAVLLQTFPRRIFPVRFLSGNQYLQSILKSTVRKPSNLHTMISSSVLEPITFLYAILLFDTSTVSKKLAVAARK